MKSGILKWTSAALGALLMMQGTGTLLPQPGGESTAVLTASAAEDDYAWTTLLKNADSWFGSAEAIRIADECIQYQVSGEGGWQKGMTTSHTGDWAHSTVDNDATTSQIRFLMRTYAQTKQQKYLDCAMRGVDCLFKMQYSNGGYMQVLNTPGTYHAHITLNDGAYVHIMQIMDEMSRKTGDFTAVSDAYAQKAAQSLEKAIQCLLDMQIVSGGTKTAWCQQHNENDLKPAGARAYELSSICTSESAGVITYLYNYAKAHPERTDIVSAVNAAIEWFKKAALYNIKFDWNSDKSDKVVTKADGAGPIWARFYTLDTQVPMFSDRDGGTYYDVAQISQERRTGYAWYGNWGKNVISLALLEEAPVREPEYHGALIGTLTVHDTKNGANWSIVPDFGTGSIIFGDRDYTVTGEGNGVGSGGEQIRTACDSKTYSGDLATLTAAEDLKLNIYLDQRVLQSLSQDQLSASWLRDYVHMRTQVFSSNNVEFTVFTRDVKKGETVTLGSNFTAQNCVNYFAAVYPAAAETTTAATTATTTETTTTTTTAVVTTTSSTTADTETTGAPLVKVKGDVDENGEVNVLDAVLLARIVGDEAGLTVSKQAKLNAMIDDDGSVDSTDLSILMLYLARKIDKLPG